MLLKYLRPTELKCLLLEVPTTLPEAKGVITVVKKLKLTWKLE